MGGQPAGFLVCSFEPGSQIKDALQEAGASKQEPYLHRTSQRHAAALVEAELAVNERGPQLRQGLLPPRPYVPIAHGLQLPSMPLGLSDSPPPPALYPGEQLHVDSELLALFVGQVKHAELPGAAMEYWSHAVHAERSGARVEAYVPAGHCVHDPVAPLKTP